MPGSMPGRRSAKGTWGVPQSFATEELPELRKQVEAESANLSRCRRRQRS